MATTPDLQLPRLRLLHNALLLPGGAFPRPHLLLPKHHPRVREVLVTHSCLTLFDSMVCSPAGSSVHGIFQARILEWVAMHLPFSGRSS